MARSRYRRSMVLDVLERWKSDQRPEGSLEEECRELFLQTFERRSRGELAAADFHREVGARQAM
ncbi:MAG: hypothetical protein HY319_16020 [Armatimonadetes bacterium]|nr:hypothetical protein [Armatimonadota bacterium]